MPFYDPPPPFSTSDEGGGSQPLMTNKTERENEQGPIAHEEFISPSRHTDTQNEAHTQPRFPYLPFPLLHFEFCVCGGGGDDLLLCFSVYSFLGSWRLS